MNKMTDENQQREALWANAVQTFRKGDKAGALFLFKKLSQQGSLAALLEIGNIYELGGNGVEQDYVEARRWYERAVNEADEIKAYSSLGRLYYCGHGVQQDFSKAFFYFNKLKEENEPGVLYMIGKMYAKGLGVERDIDSALLFLRQSADLGNAVAPREIAVIEMENGQRLSGALSWLRATFRLAWILLRDPGDNRIKI